MPIYNFLFFLAGNYSEAEVPEQLEAIKALLVANGADSVTFENAGRQKMAYPTDNHVYGYLINSTFQIEEAKVTSLKEKVGLEKQILRYMVSRLPSGKAPVALADLSVITQRDNRNAPKAEGAKEVKEEAAPAVFTQAKEAALEVKAEVVEKEEVVEEVKAEAKPEKKKAKAEKMDLNDINKKIDEILQQDDFVV